MQLCGNGHLSVAQWLHGFDYVDIYAENNSAFRGTCSNGHLSVAQWEYGLGGVDIHAKDDEVFRRACRHGHLSVVQWLHGLGNIPPMVRKKLGNSYDPFFNNLIVMKFGCVFDKYFIIFVISIIIMSNIHNYIENLDRDCNQS
jgi:hypothetical protein